MNNKGALGTLAVLAAIILVGVALSSVFTALITFTLLVFADERSLSGVLHWLAGGFGDARWSTLPFPLLADSDGMTASAYGVKSRFLGISIAKRQTFLIDPQGHIAKHYEDVDPDTHSSELLADLAELTGIPAEQEN